MKPSVQAHARCTAREEPQAGGGIHAPATSPPFLTSATLSPFPLRGGRDQQVPQVPAGTPAAHAEYAQPRGGHERWWDTEWWTRAERPWFRCSFTASALDDLS